MDESDGDVAYDHEVDGNSHCNVVERIVAAAVAVVGAEIVVAAAAIVGPVVWDVRMHWNYLAFLFFRAQMCLYLCQV